MIVLCWCDSIINMRTDVVINIPENNFAPKYFPNVYFTLFNFTVTNFPDYIFPRFIKAFQTNIFLNIYQQTKMFSKITPHRNYGILYYLYCYILIFYSTSQCMYKSSMAHENNFCTFMMINNSNKLAKIIVFLHNFNVEK